MRPTMFGVVCALAMLVSGCEGLGWTGSPCQSLEFICADNGCVSGAAVCDGVADCDDGSDELVCPCEEEDLTCSDGSCVLSADICDGTAHCPDGEDEAACDCITCDDWWEIYRITFSPPVDVEVCAGAANDALQDFYACICGYAGADCLSECPYLCGSSLDPSADNTAACQSCLSGAFAVSCTSELSDCQSH